VRRAAIALALALALAPSAFAQYGSRPSNQGSIALDAMVAPTTGFGFGYYVTDGLSLRPWLGLGYSDYGGFFANVGAQLQYEFNLDSRVAPYLSASALYSHGGSGTYYAQPGRPGEPTGQAASYQSDFGEFGAGAGLRFRVARSFSLFVEGRALYATYGSGSVQQQGWGSFDMGDHTRGELVMGLSYLLH
jgi:hypothetical protein